MPTWIKTGFFCVSCSEKTVWTLPGSYVDYSGGGDKFACASCGVAFFLVLDEKVTYKEIAALAREEKECQNK